MPFALCRNIFLCYFVILKFCLCNGIHFVYAKESLPCHCFTVQAIVRNLNVRVFLCPLNNICMELIIQNIVYYIPQKRRTCNIELYIGVQKVAAENEPLIFNVQNCCTEYPEAGFIITNLRVRIVSAK